MFSVCRQTYPLGDKNFVLLVLYPQVSDNPRRLVGTQ